MQFLMMALLISFSSFAATDADFFDSNFGDYQENLEEATAQHKAGLFVFFHLDDCPFCQKMRETVLNQTDVIAFYKQNFLNFALDANGSLEMIDFAGNSTTEKQFAAKQHNVFATPVLAFFDLNANLVAYKTGFLDKADFLLLARFVLDKKYLTEPFMRYKVRHKYQ